MFVKLCLCVSLLVAGTSAYEDKTIAQWLTDNGYNTLVSLLKSANLYDTLNNQATGPFTLFAPTDAAFAAVPPATLASLQTNQAVLATVLKYHVVNGFNLAPLISDGTVEPSLNGQSLLFHKYPNSTVTVEGAKIQTTDQIVNNGVIHTIDSVLLPVTETIGEVLLERQDKYSTLNVILQIVDLEPALMDQPSLTETIGEVLLERQDKYSTLNVILQIFDLEPALMGGHVTLFAPTDAAFNAIQSALPAFTAPNVKAAYAEILMNHVVNGTYFSRDLKDGQKLTTIHGEVVTVHLTNGPQIDNTDIIEPDIKALNGVVHGINGVLVPTNL